MASHRLKIVLLVPFLQFVRIAQYAVFVLHILSTRA